jgi:hypothetical protein
VVDAVDEWLDQCGRTLAEAEVCAERLSRAGRADGVAMLSERITRLRGLLDKARRERAIFERLDETDP